MKDTAKGASPVRERLKELVERSGLKQAEIARRIGVDRNWVNQRITGAVKVIPADDLPLLALAIGCHPCDFFEDRPQARETSIADVVARELSEGWDELPEPERELISGLVELRRRYREQALTQEGA
ncbi:MAG: XRE family transcriptional regulator [Chloroflexi bacterium]|nr:XRE family transcriptional regulator [Chloroflexota bacterium]